MKHIKAKFRLTAPSAEPFDAYGWESLWTKKTAIVDGSPVEVGQIVNFQPITVQRDGKCLILASAANIKKIKALLEKKQMTLAPGETLEVPEFKPAEVVEDVWPELPEAVAETAEAVPVAAKPKRARSVKAADLTPDTED